MHITPLGSGREVGRSCHLLKFRGCTILLDCGIHPGYPGEEGLPYFDHCEPEDIDILLITHFHLDHAGSLPYFTERTGFKGRIFMTHPTRAVLRLLLFDCLRLINVNSKGNSSQSQPNSRIPSASESIFTEHELKSCIDKVELLDYHSVMSIGPIKFWAYNAGHVLGACMFMIEVSLVLASCVALRCVALRCVALRCCICSIHLFILLTSTNPPKSKSPQIKIPRLRTNVCYTLAITQWRMTGI